MARFSSLLGWCTGLIGALLMTAVGVSPDQAASNISGWLKYFGAEELPQIVTSNTADVVTFIIGLLLVVVALLIWKLPRLRSWLSARSISRSTPSNELPAAIEFRGGWNNKAIGNYSSGPGPAVRAVEETDFEARQNVRIDPAAEKKN